MVSTDDDSDTKSVDKMEWDADKEIQLFYALFDHKPVGACKHFQMLYVAEKLSNSLAKAVSKKEIWDHLDTMYDLQMLDETEPPTFSVVEAPFSLPEKEFGALMKQKLKEVDEADDAQSPSPTRQLTRHRSNSSNNKGRKDSTGGLLLATKTRKESGSSHASTETPRSERSSGPRRDSRDSNASGPRDHPSSSRKSLQKDKRSKGTDEDTPTRRAPRRRTNTPTVSPPTTRRRT